MEKRKKSKFQVREKNQNQQLQSKTTEIQKPDSTQEQRQIEAGRLYELTVFDRARTQWQMGDWENLSKTDIDEVQNSLDKGKLALLIGSAYLQMGDAAKGKQFIHFAKECGVNKALISKTLVASLHTTLGRIYLAKEENEKAIQNFRESVRFLFPHLDNKSIGETLACTESARMGLLPQAVNLLDLQIRDFNKTTCSRNLQLKILETELQHIQHELSLALQKQQLYQTKRQEIQQDNKSTKRLSHLRKKSLSQLGQDLWVLEKTNYKRNGYFVEIGASDGVRLSNTWLLEKEFGWHGICVEPNPTFFEHLKKNRRCIVSQFFVDEETGKDIEFILAGFLGSSKKVADDDFHSERRSLYKEAQKKMEVKSISLNDLLKLYYAPNSIDYISIDTEGNEYDILKNFPFDKWDIKLFSIEHNFTDKRQKIFELLSKHGYIRTEREWDDWYEKK